MWNATFIAYYRIPFKFSTAYVTGVITSACVTVRVSCPARAYKAFVTWYLILSRLQKWFTRARKQKRKICQQKLLSKISWEEITTTKKRLSSLRIPTMVSCCWLQLTTLIRIVLRNIVFDIHTTSQPQPYNKCRNKGGDGRAPAEFIVMITLFLSNLWFWAQM